MRYRVSVLMAVLATLFVAAAAQSQTCRQQVVTASGSAVTITTGYEKSPTNVSNADTVDGAYYDITNALGLGPSPLVRTMYSNWVQTNASNTLCTNCDPAGTHPAIYGATFVNPTNQAITVTQVDFTTNVDNFTPTTITTIAPGSGWQPVSQTNRRLVRWSGSIVVPSRGAQDFVFGDSPQNNAANNTSRSVNITAAVTTSAGTFTGPTYNFTAYTNTKNEASNAGVTFDATGGATPVPIVFFAGRSSTAPVSLPIRVGESGNNGAPSAIAKGLQLTVTIPARWSAVSVPTIGAPWSSATLSITQPTSTTDGQVVISTSAAINAGTSTAANTLVIRATAPVSSATNLFPFRLSLNGASAGGKAITSFNDSVVQVLGNGTEAVNTQLVSAALTGPIRQIDFSSALTVADGTGSESVAVQVYNNTTSSWDTVSTVTPGASNVTVSRSFGADFVPYLSANQMKVRFVSNGTTVRTLRLDQVRWLVTRGYTVNNAAGVGNDTNSGDVARPFASLQRAASVVAGSGAVYVEVGASQTGSPYASNLQVTASGTSGCLTLFQGVPSGGLLPKIAGVTPTDAAGNPVDFGFDINANYVQVDGFQIENTGVAWAVEPGYTGAIASNNTIVAATNGYGIVVNSPVSATVVSGNTISAAASASPLYGIVDVGSSTRVDGNRVYGMPSSFGIYEAGDSPVIQRNIFSGAYAGIYLGGITGAAKLYNNTVDGNIIGIHADTSGVGSVTLRNNVVTRNTTGIETSTGGVDSDYDDVYNNYSVNSDNSHNDQNYSAVTAGAHSISADPLFAQSTDPTTATYYRLLGGSPCIDRGIGVSLPFLGTAPDLGAVESQ